MKKLIITAAVAMFLTTSFAQQSRRVRKDEKKQEKMDKKMTERENARHAGNGKKAEKDLRKMEKKEDKLNKKAEK
jgi:peptidoglycan hydrolase CwlO-like protein